MTLEWLFLTGPWAVALWALLVALLLAACLRAVRRRRAVVPGLAIFSRVKAHTLPPAPPPRWLDRSFVFKALLLGALTAICAGLALVDRQPASQRVAFLIDDGPAGQYRVWKPDPEDAKKWVDGGKLAARLQAAAQATRQDPTLADVTVETVTLSSLAAPSAAPLSLMQALQLLQTRAGVESTGWATIHVFTPYPPPADLATQVGSQRVVWHQPDGTLQANLGIVRVHIEAAPSSATSPATPADGSDWLVWADIADSADNALMKFEQDLDFACTAVTSTGATAGARIVAQQPGVLGPLAVHLPASCDRLQLATSWHEMNIRPHVLPPNWQPFEDGFVADDSVTLQYQPGKAAVARLLGAADTPMVRAALAAWQIPVEEPTEAAEPAPVGGKKVALLLISDGGPAAAAELTALRRGGRTVLPVYLNPQLDVDGLQLPGGDAKPKSADRTFVPAGALASYGVLNRASWQIAAVRPVLLLYGGTTVVDSPVGPAVVRWVDPDGQPAWALLFDPAQSSLAGRDTGGWLAWWRVLAQEAAGLVAPVDADDLGAGWRIDRTQTAAGVPDRRLTSLAPTPDGKVTTFGESPAKADGGSPPADPAATASHPAAVRSLAGLAAALALVLLCLVILAEAGRAPTTSAA